MANPLPERDPITCHVLDTTTGRPGANIPVKLSCISGAPEIDQIVFESSTNQDGRIGNWELSFSSFGLALVGEVTKGLDAGLEARFMMQNLIRTVGMFAEQPNRPIPGCPAGSSLWKLQFDTASYYGPQNTFFPRVELTFLARENEHFHVPLLLGPYSFTTYRGS